MSCLSITELPLDEQAQLELAYAQRLVDRINHLLRADPPTPPRGFGQKLPAAFHAPHPAGRPSFPATNGDTPMLQREIRHPSGTFRPCQCGALPRHIEARGALSTEPFDPFHPAGNRHRLECSNADCGARTAWMPTLETAVLDWRHKFAVPARSVARPVLRLHKQETA